MGVDFVVVPAGGQVGEAVAAVAAAASLQPEALTSVHAVDERGKLRGVASLVRLVQAARDAPLADVWDDDPVRVGADTDVVDVAVLMSDYNLITVPVVDDQRRMIGLITVDDVLEATLPEDWRRREAAEPPDAHRGSNDDRAAGMSGPPGERRRWLTRPRYRRNRGHCRGRGGNVPRPATRPVTGAAQRGVRRRAPRRYRRCSGPHPARRRPRPQRAGAGGW